MAPGRVNARRRVVAPRAARRARRLALLVAPTLALALATCGAGYSLARPAAARVGHAPADLGATALTMPSRSGSALLGWYAPPPAAPARGAALLMHGVRANRLAMLDRARMLRAAGYAVLLFDFQAHGESPGAHITFGARESLDAHAALAALRARAPGARVGAIGVSLGGAAALLGRAGPLPVDALVLESVYPTIDEATADRLRMRLGALGPPLAPLLLWQLAPHTGVTRAELRPIDAVRRLRAPVLVASGTADTHTTADETRRLFAAAPEPKTLWLVPGAAHQDLHAYAPGEYARRVLAFFAAHVRR